MGKVRAFVGDHLGIKTHNNLKEGDENEGQFPSFINP